LPVTDVPQIDLPQVSIGLAHALQQTYGANPKHRRQDHAPKQSRKVAAVRAVTSTNLRSR